MSQGTDKPRYKENTSMRAVFDQLREMQVGETAHVETYNLFSGELNSHAKTRMSISKVSRDTGMKFITRVVDGNLQVRRIK